jgi:hypothetical protein
MPDAQLGTGKPVALHLTDDPADVLGPASTAQVPFSADVALVQLVQRTPRWPSLKRSGSFAKSDVIQQTL